MAGQKVLEVEALSKVVFTNINPIIWEVHPILDPFKNVGPHLDDIQAFAFAEGWGAGLQFKLFFRKSYNGVLYEDASGDLISSSTPTAAAPIWGGTPYNTRSDFWPNLQLMVGIYHPTSGGISGTLSARVAFRFAT